MRARSIPAAPNSLTTASNSTSLCSAPTTSRHSLFSGINFLSAIVRRHGSIGACRSRTNADDRFARASLGRIEGGDGIVESRDVADVRPQPSIPHPLHDLSQLGTIGLDDEVNRQAVGGLSFGRADDG